MDNEKSLQNLTFAEPFDNIRHLLQTDYVTHEDLSKLNQREKQLLVFEVSQRLDELARIDRQGYINEAKKYENVLEEKSRNRNWDANHIRIKNYVEEHLEKYGCLPSITEMASEINLSRQTISKHLAEFEMGDYMKEEMQMFNVMFSDLMATLYNIAKDGDVSAIKLYAEILEKRNVGSNTINIKNQQINVMLKELFAKNLSNS